MAAFQDFRQALDAARNIQGAEGARRIVAAYADLNRDHGPVGTYDVDTDRILSDLGGDCGPAYTVTRCAPWGGVGVPDYVIRHAAPVVG